MTHNQSTEYLARCLLAPSEDSRNGSNFKMHQSSPYALSRLKPWQHAALGLPRSLASPPQHTAAAGGSLTPAFSHLGPSPLRSCLPAPGTHPHGKTSFQVRSRQYKARGRRKPVISLLAEILKKYSDVVTVIISSRHHPGRGKRD